MTNGRVEGTSVTSLHGVVSPSTSFGFSFTVDALMPTNSRESDMIPQSSSVSHESGTMAPETFGERRVETDEEEYFLGDSKELS